MACYSASIFITSLLALGLSAYSVYVESRISEDDEYEALCDLGPEMSCSKVFSSEYSKGFGLDFLPEELKLPNGFYGIGFYFVVAALSEFLMIYRPKNCFLITTFPLGFTKNLALVKLQFLLSVTSVLVSIYLAYVLYFVLSNLCVVCVAAYILNFISVVLVWKKLSQLSAKPSKQD
jgi:vitamin-K-epoxide reductase (warfarin-sensitive)